MRVGKYSLIIIFVLFVLINTILLVTFNKFSNSVIGNKTIIGLKNDIMNYKKGGLLIVSKSLVNTSDEILFYDTKNSKKFLNHEVIKGIITTENDITYIIKDNEYISDDYVIGNTKDIKYIPLAGYLYTIFTSKIGYLLFVILPIVIYFILILRNYKKYEN